MFDAYKVAVKLTLVNHISTGLIAVSQQLGKVHSGANAAQGSLSLVEQRLAGIKRMGLVGGAMAGAGLGMLGLMKGPVEEAAAFDKAVGKFKLFGMGDKVNSEAVKFANGMHVVGSSYTENMKLMTEAQGVFRESGLDGSAALEGAKLAAPMLAKIKFASVSLDDESQEKMKTASLAMLRYIEMSGGLADAETFNKIANAGWKAIQSSGGNIDWEQLRQARAKAGTALMGSSERALYGEDEPLIGELKGGGYGDGLMTSYNRLTGVVKLPNQVAHLLTQHKIWDEKQIEWNSQGGIKSFKANPFKDLDLFSKSRLEFYESKMLPMYKEMHLSENEIYRENAMIFGRTGGRLFNLIHRQRETMHRSADAWDKAPGVDQSVNVAKESASGQAVILRAEWHKVQRDLGTAVLPLAISAVKGMTAALTAFTEFAKEHPGIVKGLTVAFAGLAVTLAIGGTITLLAAGFSGLSLAAGVAAGASGIPLIGGALAALAGPVGIAVLVIGTIAAACYAFRGLTKEEVSSARTEGGARLTADAMARSNEMGWKPPMPGIDVGPTKAASVVTVGEGQIAKQFPWANQPRIPATPASGANQPPAARPSSFVPPPPPAPVFKVENKFDAHGISTRITQQMGASMARPQTGPNFVDGSMAPVPVAYAGR